MRLAFMTLLSAGICLCPVAHADPVQYTADKWHTRIFFEVASGSLTKFVSTFREFDIEFMFDEENFEKQSRGSHYSRIQYRYVS